jgi:PAS domain-containing protein
MIDNNPLTCVIWDAGFNIIDCNQVAADIFGYKSKADFCHGFQKLAQPEQVPGSGIAGRTTGLAHLNDAFKSGYEHYLFLHESLTGKKFTLATTGVRTEQNKRPLLLVYGQEMPSS